MTQRDTRWMLVRAPAEPMIWPFESQDDALAWADEYGLADYTAQPMADRDEHEAICGRCRELWPCKHERVEQTAKRIEKAAKHTCARCKKGVGWYVIRIPAGGELGEDIQYHGRKGACRNEAVRRLRELGRHDELAKVEEDERRRAQWREEARTVRS